MPNTKPIFRADHVGSLFRPQAIKDVRKAYLEDGSINADVLSRVEDEAICQAVALQQSAGLKAVTDGEYRRSFWHDEAAKFADLDQLGIAPQCGFASTEEGNKVSEDEQVKNSSCWLKQQNVSGAMSDRTTQTQLC